MLPNPVLWWSLVVPQTGALGLTHVRDLVALRASDPFLCGDVDTLRVKEIRRSAARDETL